MEIKETIIYTCEFEEKNSIFKELLGDDPYEIAHEYNLSSTAAELLINDEIFEIPNVYPILKIIDNYNLYDYIKEKIKGN